MPKTKESWYSFRRLFIFSPIVAVVFAWGVATGNWHLFPYEPLKSAFRFVKPAMPIAEPQTEYLADVEARTLKSKRNRPCSRRIAALVGSHRGSTFGAHDVSERISSQPHS